MHRYTIKIKKYRGKVYLYEINRNGTGIAVAHTKAEAERKVREFRNAWKRAKSKRMQRLRR